MSAELTHRSKPRVALTMGDPNGIGPEIAVLAAEAVRAELDVFLVGEETVFEKHASMRGLAVGVPVVPPAHGADDPSVGSVDFGRITSAAGRRSMEAVRHAVTMCLNGDVDAMVTAPISKESIALAGYPFPGHTEFIAHLCGCEDELMIMVADSLRVALATVHIPLRAVADTLSSTLVETRLATLAQSLRRDFGVDEPRIAVLGLNPHAGDGGVIGKEEQDLIGPAIASAREKGIVAEGPFPADGFFGNRAYQSFDGVLAMYHDQGLVPFKTLSFNRGCNFTAGVPIVRVSPDHGTAFDIAGRGVASPASLIEALRVAASVARTRTNLVAPSADKGGRT